MKLCPQPVLGSGVEFLPIDVPVERPVRATQAHGLWKADCACQYSDLFNRANGGFYA